MGAQNCSDHAFQALLARGVSCFMSWPTLGQHANTWVCRAADSSVFEKVILFGSVFEAAWCGEDDVGRRRSRD